MKIIVLRKLDCGCEILSDDSIYECASCQFKRLNLDYPEKFPSFEKFVESWLIPYKES